MTMRIAQISDLHVSPEKGFFNANLDTLTDALHASRPDMILNSGDLGFFGERDNGDLAFAMQRLAPLGIEMHHVPGNHDVGEHPGIPGADWVNEASLARYRKNIGPDFWMRDIPGWRLVGLNALTLGTGLSGDEEQCTLLRSAMISRAGRSVALVMHKPLADADYAESEVKAHFTTPDARRRVLAALGPDQPALILCGHVHQYRVSDFGGSRHIWCPPASFIIGDPWQPSYGAKGVGYLEHRFHADGTHEHGFKTVRGLVHHDLQTMPHVYGDVTARGPGKG